MKKEVMKLIGTIADLIILSLMLFWMAKFWFFGTHDTDAFKCILLGVVYLVTNTTKKK